MHLETYSAPYNCGVKHPFGRKTINPLIARPVYESPDVQCGHEMRLFMCQGIHQTCKTYVTRLTKQQQVTFYQYDAVGPDLNSPFPRQEANTLPIKLNTVGLTRAYFQFNVPSLPNNNKTRMTTYLTSKTQQNKRTN